MTEYELILTGFLLTWAIMCILAVAIVAAIVADIRDAIISIFPEPTDHPQGGTK